MAWRRKQRGGEWTLVWTESPVMMKMSQLHSLFPGCVRVCSYTWHLADDHVHIRASASSSRVCVFVCVVQRQKHWVLVGVQHDCSSVLWLMFLSATKHRAIIYNYIPSFICFGPVCNFKMWVTNILACYLRMWVLKAIRNRSGDLMAPSSNKAVKQKFTALVFWQLNN